MNTGKIKVVAGSNEHVQSLVSISLFFLQDRPLEKKRKKAVQSSKAFRSDLDLDFFLFFSALHSDEAAEHWSQSQSQSLC